MTKSLALISSQNALSDFRINELKLFNLYLSRIDLENPEQRNVHINFGELEMLLGTHLTSAQLQELLDALFFQVEVPPEVVSPGRRFEKGFVLISLFESCGYTCNEEDGTWELDLKCTESARKYILTNKDICRMRRIADKLLLQS